MQNHSNILVMMSVEKTQRSYISRLFMVIHTKIWNDIFQETVLLLMLTSNTFCFKEVVFHNDENSPFKQRGIYHICLCNHFQIYSLVLQKLVFFKNKILHCFMYNVVNSITLFFPLGCHIFSRLKKKNCL